MANFERDAERLSGCLDRLRLAVRAAPFTFVALFVVSFGILGAAFGLVWMILLSLIGAMLGLFLSQIVAAILESMALILIYLDRNDDGGGNR